MEPSSINGAGVTLVIYMLALLAIGFWASRRATASEDAFLLGGRSLGPVVSGLAYAASTSSAWVLLGYTGFVATVGVSALWMVPGILFGYGCVWLWLGPWLNRVSREKGYLTAIDVIAGETTGMARRIIVMSAAAMILFCFSFYIAVQFQGAGAALADVFGLSPTAAILAGALVILAYTFLGGFWAVSVTDTLQGISIAIVACVLPVAALIDIGGFGGIAEGLQQQPESLTAPFGVYAGWSVVGFLFGLSSLGIGAMGQPHLLTWIMAVRDRKSRIQGAAVSIGWGALVFSGMSIIALAARATSEPGAGLGEMIIFDLAQQTLPGILPALVYAAILSAVMSTVDSQLLVASAAGSHDLGLAKLAPNREVLVTRVVIVTLCFAAILITLQVPASIFDRAIFAWTALGAAFGPSIVARMLGRRMSAYTVLAAMVSGFSLTVFFNQIDASGPGAWLERGLPWVVGATILTLFSKRREAEASVLQEADSASV
ncbi:MAG: sodium/proline symporter [Pseudomonadota bacterium]